MEKRTITIASNPFLSKNYTGNKIPEGLFNSYECLHNLLMIDVIKKGEKALLTGVLDSVIAFLFKYLSKIIAGVYRPITIQNQHFF